MAVITKGYSFGATEVVTNSKLHTLVDSATIASIAQTDVLAGEGLNHIGATAPSDTDQLWVDTTTAPYILRYYDGTNWSPVAEYGVLTNKAGQSLGVGRVVIIDTSNDNAFKVTSTAADTKFAGVLLASAANNATGAVASHGFAIAVLTEICASAGTFLRTSTATGKAEPTSFGSGVFGILTTSASGSGTAHLFGVVGGGTQVADNNTWTGTNTFSGNVSLNGVTTITTASASTTNWQPLIQIVNTQTGASATGTTTIPNDDTTPLISEGDQYMSVAITPKNAANTLEIIAVGNFAHNNGGVHCMALFSNIGSATASAIAAMQRRIDSVNDLFSFTLATYLTAGTASATTFSIRSGNAAAGTTTFNGFSGSRKLGSVMASSLTIKEWKS